MYVALDNIFLLSNTNIMHFSKNALALVCRFIFIYQSTVHCCSPAHSNLYLNQANADTRDSVTTSVTLHYLCHSVSQGDREKLQHTAGQHVVHTRTGKPDYKHTLTHHSHWSDHRCAHGKYAHTHMQKPFCPHLSPVRAVSNTHTWACTLHPCAVQPPTLLKAAALGACACESGCGLSSPHRCTPSAQGSEGNEGFRSSL